MTSVLRPGRDVARFDFVLGAREVTMFAVLLNFDSHFLSPSNHTTLIIESCGNGIDRVTSTTPSSLVITIR